MEMAQPAEESKPRRQGLLADVAAGIAAFFALLLLWVQVPVTYDLRSASPQREQGLAWFVDLAKFKSKYFSVEGDTLDKPERSSARVLEDGRPLGPAHSMHESIRTTGAGRYSHWQGALYFSSSDGSDVATNGRKYALRVGVGPPLWSLVLVLAGSIGFLVARHRRALRRYSPRRDPRLRWLARLAAEPAPVLGDPAVARSDPPSLRGLAVLLAAILLVACYQGYRGADWEMLATKHYWNSQEWFYGGYADLFEATPRGLRAIMKESLVSYQNLFPFGETAEPSLRKHQVGGWPSTERLAVPYLAYLITTLTRGLVEVWTVFFLLNVALWLSAIFFAYRLASVYFGDRYSPLFAALFVTFYPAFLLNFHAVKISYIGTAFLLGGIFVFETRLRDRPAYLRFAVLAAIFFLGQFATGGWVFLFVFLFVRLLGIPGVARLAHLVTLVLAVVTALAALAYLRRIYLLPSVDQQMSTSYLEILFGTYDWLSAWMRGGDVSAHKFLNYAGFTFFNGYFPLVTLSFIRGHWPLMSLFLFALIFLRAARKFLVPCVLLLAAAHAGVAITGWTFHYGYLSAPAAMMLILPAAGLLGRLGSQQASGMKALAFVLLMAVVLGFMNQKRHAGLYFGGVENRYLPRIVIHYGESDGTVEY